jgi:epoxide hydrolase-like predicted phosphatase
MTWSGAVTPVELVIFDYGGVISERVLDDMAMFDELMGLPAGSLDRLLFGEIPQGVVTDGDPIDGAYDEPGTPVHDFHLLETGAISFDVYLEGLVERAPSVIGRPLDPEDFFTFAASTPVRIQWPIIHELRRLQADGVALALLTNNVKEFGDGWRSSFPVHELFGVVVDSCEVGMRKPDPRIYELTCSRCGVEPSRAVFLDDNVDNVAASRALGIETVHVTGDAVATITELRAILDRRGILASQTRA